MTNKEVFDIAMRQSALDINAHSSDFVKNTNVFVRSEIGTSARKYYKEPIACNLVSYGSNIVASVKDEYRDIIEIYLSKFEFYNCFETPNIHWLDERMKEYGYRVCFMAEYFLPNVDILTGIECKYQLRMLEQKDFKDLYLPGEEGDHPARGSGTRYQDLQRPNQVLWVFDEQHRPWDG